MAHHLWYGTTALHSVLCWSTRDLGAHTCIYHGDLNNVLSAYRCAVDVNREVQKRNVLKSLLLPE